MESVVWGNAQAESYAKIARDLRLRLPGQQVKAEEEDSESPEWDGVLKYSNANGSGDKPLGRYVFILSQ